MWRCRRRWARVRRCRQYSTHIQKLDVEDERRVRRNHASGSLCSIPECGRNGERTLSADLHASNTLVPARNDFSAAKAECEWFVSIARTVELRTLVIGFSFVVKPACIVHLDAASGRGLVAGSSFHILLHQLRDVGLTHVASTACGKHADEQSRRHTFHGLDYRWHFHCCLARPCTVFTSPLRERDWRGCRPPMN